MITIYPSKDHPLIVQFDGQILEIIDAALENSCRLHVGLLNDVQIVSDRRNNHKFVIHWSYVRSLMCTLMNRNC